MRSKHCVNNHGTVNSREFWGFPRLPWSQVERGWVIAGVALGNWARIDVDIHRGLLNYPGIPSVTSCEHPCSIDSWCLVVKIHLKKLMHRGLFLECATRMQDGVTVASVTISEMNFCSSQTPGNSEIRWTCFPIQGWARRVDWPVECRTFPTNHSRSRNPRDQRQLEPTTDVGGEGQITNVPIWIIQALMRFWISFLCCTGAASCQAFEVWYLETSVKESWGFFGEQDSLSS